MTTNQRIEEISKLLMKLHLLDDKELMYVAGTVAALSAIKKQGAATNS